MEKQEGGIGRMGILKTLQKELLEFFKELVYHLPVCGLPTYYI